MLYVPDERLVGCHLVSICPTVAGPAPVLYLAQDKVTGLISRAQFMPCLLTTCTLEVRDVSEREEWATAHAGEVPVLAVAGEDGVEVREGCPSQRHPQAFCYRLPCLCSTVCCPTSV